MSLSDASQLPFASQLKHVHEHSFLHHELSDMLVGYDVILYGPGILSDGGPGYPTMVRGCEPTSDAQVCNYCWSRSAPYPEMRERAATKGICKRLQKLQTYVEYLFVRHLIRRQRSARQHRNLAGTPGTSPVE